MWSTPDLMALMALVTTVLTTMILRLLYQRQSTLRTFRDFSFLATSGLLSTGEATVSQDQVQSEISGYQKLFDGRDQVGEISSIESVARRQAQYKDLVDSFYNLVTDFYEYGWGQSFHFANRFAHETFEASIARAEHFLALKLALKSTSRVLDMGCGIGGPMRAIHRFSGAHIKGITINQYQVKVANRYNVESGMGKHCHVVQGDFMSMPFEDNTFDAVYCIESTCHSPDKAKCFAEALRILKPGGLITGYEWVTTCQYDSTNEEHVRLKEGIEIGNGLPTIESGADVQNALCCAGFNLLEAWNAAAEQRPGDVAWYDPLAGKCMTWRGFRMTPWGRQCTHAMIQTMEMLKIAPKGSMEVSQLLNQTAVDLVRSGELGIFTPNYFFLAEKPTSVIKH